jgi:acyl carrier protein
MTGNRTNNLTVMDALKTILVGLGIPEDTIREDTLIHAHLGLDSVETVKLSLELKRQFDLDLKLGTRKDLTLAEICQMVAIPLPARSA